MARILGLDLGSYTVRALVLDTSMRGFQVAAYGEVRRGEGELHERLRAALSELFEQGPPMADQVVACMPGQTMATHLLTLPFQDSKRLEATIPFEIEGQLPFDLGDAVYDYQVINTKPGATELMVGVVRRDELKGIVDVLDELQVQPRIVVGAAIAYHSILSAAPELLEGADEQSSVAIVDIGHERTCVAIGKRAGALEFSRTFSGGGKDLTRTLAAEFQTAPLEANAWKEAQGALGSTVSTPEGERAAAAFIRGLAPVVRELRASFKSYGARARQPVSRVYLCGGTALLPGIDEHLTRELSMPVQRLTLPAVASATVPPAAQPAAAQAFALALRGQASSSKALRFNLRRGEFAFKGGLDYLKDKAPIWGALAAAVLLLFVGTGIARNIILARREKAVDDKLCEVTQRVLGGCERNFDKALLMLRGKESPTASLPNVSAVQLLAELIQRVPSDVPVTFSEIRMNLEGIRLKGQTESSKHIDTLTNALKGHRCFKEVQPQGKVEKTSDGKGVQFSLNVHVRCPEGAPPQG